MTRQYRQFIGNHMHALQPEQLLLLTIFGTSKTRRQVDEELDRRAALRPARSRAVHRAGQLLPAA
jgi:hypothetical protein